MDKNCALIKCIISCLLFLVDSKKEDKKEDSSREEEPGEMAFICPLCREGFRDKETLENHAMAVHGVNAEGLQRLMMLMQGSHWLNNAKNNKDEESGSIYTLYFFL